MSEMAIQVKDLSKVYKLYNKPSDRLKETLGFHVDAREHYALKHVNFEIRKGETVGIIAAQSIGEPGTQLTMRTFHTGGIASAEDITQGLPRVEELFESRRPKNAAIITKVSGKVRYEEIKKTRHAIITQNDGTEEAYAVPFGYRPKVYDGDTVIAGDALTEGSINPHDVLEVKGEEAVQNYIIAEVQKVYRLQGVDINDKHIEVIVRQMMRKIRITDPGDSFLLPGSIIGKNELTTVCEEIQARIDAGEVGLRMPESEAVLLGITKASLATDSFLSAASFQETTRVLTDAAIRGKIDPLLGLKENVIIGKLIPVGTGMKRYRNTRLSTDAVETIDFGGDMYGDDAELNLSDGSELDAEGAELNEDVNTEAETVEVGTDADNQ